jgi:hypothetical protein
MNLDVNTFLNNKGVQGGLKALPSALSALQMGLDHFTTALNYNPYNVQLNNQTANGKALMASGGKLKKKGKKMLAEGGSLKGNPPSITPISYGENLGSSSKEDKAIIDKAEKIFDAASGFMPVTAAMRNLKNYQKGESISNWDLADMIPLGFMAKSGFKALRNAAPTTKVIDKALNIDDVKNSIIEDKNLPVNLSIASNKNDKTFKLADGGTLEGPSHEAGGIDVNENGIPTNNTAVANVEGGEFSYKDPKTGETYIFSNRLPYKLKNNGKEKK